MENLPARRDDVIEGVIDEDCNAYCSHGGICVLNAGHEGQHDTKYCQWGDEDSISKQEADSLLRTKPGGDLILLMSDLFNARP